MPKIDRLNGSSGCFELEFVEREATPKCAMQLGIRLHLAGSSLSDTVGVLDTFGVDRCRSTVRNWVQKAALQPASGANPDHVAIDETVIQLDDERYWLYAAVDPAINRLLHLRLHSSLAKPAEPSEHRSGRSRNLNENRLDAQIWIDTR